MVKTQFAHRLQDQYFAAMDQNLLQTSAQGITFTKLWAECVAMFWKRSKRSSNTTILTNMVKLKTSEADQLVKSANQVCGGQKVKVRAKTKVIEQERKDIENMKAASLQLNPKNLIETMTQAYMYKPGKGQMEKNVGTKPPGGKHYFGNKNHQN